MNESRSLDVLEAISVVGAIGGTIASVLTQQVAFAAIPLSLTATLNLANRKQLMVASQEHQAAITALKEQSKQQQLSIDELVQQDQDKQDAIATLTAQNQVKKTSIDVLTQELNEVRQKGNSLSEQIQELWQKSQNLSQKGSSFEGTLQQLKDIDRLNQAIRANPRVADLYYRRGLLRQGLNREDDQLTALDDYSQAIQLEVTHADAYFQRGILSSKIGNKRSAVQDFRAAAKCYFELGDLENYNKSRDMGQALYELISEKSTDESDESDEQVFVEGLFS